MNSKNLIKLAALCLVINADCMDAGVIRFAPSDACPAGETMSRNLYMLHQLGRTPEAREQAGEFTLGCPLFVRSLNELRVVIALAPHFVRLNVLEVNGTSLGRDDLQTISRLPVLNGVTFKNCQSSSGSALSEQELLEYFTRQDEYWWNPKR